MFLKFLLNVKFSSIWVLIFKHSSSSHPTTRCRGDAVTTSLCTSQQRRRYASNEATTNVSMERCQDVSVLRLHDVLLECRDDVSRRRYDGVPLDVSTTSQTSLKWNTQRRLRCTTPRHLSGTCLRRPISTFIQRLLEALNETLNNVVVVRLHHVSKLRCRHALSLLRSLLHFQITLSWPPSGRFSRLI